MKTLLSKIPVESLIRLALKFGFLRKPLELAAQGWNKAQGARTQASSVLGVAIWAAGALGWIPQELADPLSNGLVGVGTATALSKVNRVVEEVKKEAEKSAPPPTEPAPPPAQ